MSWPLDLYGELLETGGGKERMTRHFTVRHEMSCLMSDMLILDHTQPWVLNSHVYLQDLAEQGPFAAKVRVCSAYHWLSMNLMLWRKMTGKSHLA